MQRAAMIVAGATVVALLIPTVRHFRESAPPPPPAARLALAAPPGTELGAGDDPLDLAISPDQREIVFVATQLRRENTVQPASGVSQLWRRRLDSERAEPIPGTEGAQIPAWKQTGNVISFFADGEIKLLTLKSGEVRVVWEAPLPTGATWLRDGSLLFSWAGGTISRLLDGKASDAAPIASGDIKQLFPFALPSSQDFTYVAVPTNGPRVVRLNSSGAELGTASSQAVLAGADREWLLFVKDGTLLADTLGEGRAGRSGLDVPLAFDVGTSSSGRAFFTASSDVLFYAKAAERPRRMMWVDMRGMPVGSVGEFGDYWQVRLAPDDSRLAVTARDPLLRALDVLMVPANGALPSFRLTTSLAADTDPVWSADGRRIAFRSMQRGRPEVFATPAALRLLGSGDPAESVRTDGEVPTDWRGSEMLVQRRGKSGFDLIRINEATGSLTTIAETPFNETDARWSPDGQLIAYVSDEPGRPDIYVTDGRNERQRVSLSGGTHPRWMRDGSALLFLRGSTVMRAARTGSTFEPPQPLFDIPGVRDFDTAHRSDRIIALLPAQSEPVDNVSVLLNWRSLLPADPDLARNRRRTR